MEEQNFSIWDALLDDARRATWFDDPIFKKAAWIREDSPETSPSSQDQIFLTVGMTTSAWEGVESAFASLIDYMTESSDLWMNETVRRVFGSIESSSGRRNAFLSIAEVYFREYWPDLRRDFTVMCDGLSEAARRRDEIVHGIATSIIIENEHRGAFLFPTDYNTARNTMHPWHPDPDPKIVCGPGKYCYTHLMIHKIARKFLQLEQTLRRVGPKLRKVKGVPAVLALRHEGR